MKASRVGRVFLFLALLASTAFGAALTSRRAVAEMTTAATRFLASLSEEQRQRATFPFESEERLKWHFIPNEMFPRKGAQLKELSAEQRALAHGLLKSGLSQRGYMTATAIIDLERVLRALERAGRMARDPDEYFI